MESSSVRSTSETRLGGEQQNVKVRNVLCGRLQDGPRSELEEQVIAKAKQKVDDLFAN